MLAQEVLASADVWSGSRLLVALASARGLPRRRPRAKIAATAPTTPIPDYGPGRPREPTAADALRLGVVCVACTLTVVEFVIEVVARFRRGSSSRCVSAWASVQLGRRSSSLCWQCRLRRGGRGAYLGGDARRASVALRGARDGGARRPDPNPLSSAAAIPSASARSTNSIRIRMSFHQLARTVFQTRPAPSFVGGFTERRARSSPRPTTP